MDWCFSKTTKAIYTNREREREKMMRKVSSCVWVLVLVVVVVVSVWEVPVVSGATSPSQCKQQRQQLTSLCRPVIFGQNPSADCCSIVRDIPVECVCPYVTPKLAAIIGVERAIKKIEGCGRTVPHNFKCGS
ncbi:unnamed protein product [Camellia sinensis]